MDFTLDQVLTILGRLDDTPGFDSPRERFRRFLIEQLTSVESVQFLVRQCRERSGEQSHRVLQDVVVLFGRFLGFEPVFGRYQHNPGSMPVHGNWRSRHRLDVTLIVCTDQTPDIDLAMVSSALAEGDGDTPRIGLLVTTPLYARKSRLEQSLGAGKHPSIRLVSLRGLLHLGAMVVDERLTHEDALQVLNPAGSLDAQLDLLDRVAASGRRDPVDALFAPAGEDERHERRYWVSAMRPEPFTATERIVGSLIATRQILGINLEPGLEDRVKTGDVICVFLAGRGIVAHAHIAAILTDGSRMIRDSKRFTHVLRLTGVTVYDTPVVPSRELARKLDLALAVDGAAVTTAISSREFDWIAAHALSQAG